MKIKTPNTGALTNFEVLDFLKARGASKDSSRVIAPVASSEYKVYDYLVETPASRQTREQIYEFMKKCKTYKLAKAEILNIINIAPRELVEIDPMIEHSEMRLGDQVEELLDLVRNVFPLPPADLTSEAGMDKDREETGNEEQNEDMNETLAGEQIDGDGK
ncbi:hypothetical protein P3X46_028162 [Hevea brasiliensis]|uniref:Uncharacterized protein n=2 Tax=Hevea brasiliensis TaxID=3981 RepID=A0ABQ9KPH4_HEVBR|nr:uncharacterized protein LOC131168702 [Hevea brasiliensis]KAF2290387.1 hypothetical protein GH714_012709 [Hevea brasiliensis]KAJ9145829.1 hypothetical protein P3X46_028162 [Hevea brasiliensis]